MPTIDLSQLPSPTIIEALDFETILAEVKAVTRHKFAIEKNERWCIQVVLDV